MRTMLTAAKANRLLFAFFSILVFYPAYGQDPSDCCDAEPLSNSFMNSEDAIYVPPYLGSGATKEGMLNCATCNSEPEVNSRWFTFQCTQGGSFEFALVPDPVGLPGLLADFNFMLFANECPCGQATVMVACNDAPPHGPPNTGGNWTGISDEVNSSFPFLPPYVPPPPFPPGMDPFESTVLLTEGTTYYLYINNIFPGALSGFALYIAGTAEITPPHIGPPQEPGPGIIGDFNLCPGVTGSYSVVFPDPGAGITYNWTLTPSGPTIQGKGQAEIGIDWDETGIYTLCVNKQMGCVVISEDSCVTIEIAEIPPTFAQDSACIGWPYVADNGQVFFAPGVFNLNFVTDEGCDSLVILTLEALEHSAFFFEEIICQGESITVGGEEFFDSGVYQRTLVNSVGCDSLVTFLLIVLPFELEVIPEEDTLSCKKATVIFDASSSIVDDHATFTWLDEYGFAIDTGKVFEATYSGIFTLEVEDTNGCKGEMMVEVFENFTTPFADAGFFQTIDCKVDTAVLDGSNSSQGNYVVYEWTGPGLVSGGNTLTPVVNAAGIYVLTVTNTNSGCADVSTVEVFENKEPPIADAGQDMSLDCNTTMVTLDGSGSSQAGFFTYQWTGPGIVSGETGLMPEVNESGLYTLIVTDEDNGCTDESFVFVDLDETPPEVSGGPNQQIDCNNESAVLQGSTSAGAGATYSWSGPQILSGGTTLTPTVGIQGTYTLTVFTANGCSASAQAFVIQDLQPPIADAGETMALNCNKTSLLLDGNGSSQGNAFTYQWSGPGIQTGGDTPTPTVNQIGFYDILVTDTENGCTATSSVEVTETPPPIASISAQANVDCNGNASGSATVVVSDGRPPYSFAWSSGGNAATETGLSAGTYEVVVTDQDGCTAMASVTISEPDVLEMTASATGLTKVGANDGTATCNPIGGVMPYNYNWDNGGDTQTINNLAPGDYTVTVTDQNNCTEVQTVTVEDYDCSPVGLSVDSENVDCNGAATGQATANISNGNAPFQYEWSNGSDEATATGLTAGTYQVTVTDDNGCVLTDQVTVEEPEGLKGTLGFVDVDCFGNATGSASVEASGGTPGYTYQWSTGGTNAEEIGMPAGTHSVTITDANGCEMTLSATISEPPALDLTVNGTAETAMGANDGTATATPGGGTPGYSYEWNTGETIPMISNLAPGEYCVTVTDANGCTTTGCFTVNPFLCGEILADFETSPVSCFAGTNGEATISMTGGTPPFAFDWSNGYTGATVTGLSADTYQVTATDVNNCVLVESVTISQPDPIEITVLNITDAACEGSATGAASVEASGGTPGYSYEWSNGVTGPAIEEILPGTYTVTATDANDCTETISIEIPGESDVEPPLVQTQNVTVILDEMARRASTPI